MIPRLVENIVLEKLGSPVPVKLPLSYLDEDVLGGNTIIIWGELFDLE